MRACVCVCVCLCFYVDLVILCGIFRRCIFMSFFSLRVQVGHCFLFSFIFGNVWCWENNRMLQQRQQQQQTPTSVLNLHWPIIWMSMVLILSEGILQWSKMYLYKSIWFEFLMYAIVLVFSIIQWMVLALYFCFCSFQKKKQKFITINSLYIKAFQVIWYFTMSYYFEICRNMYI